MTKIEYLEKRLIINENVLAYVVGELLYGAGGLGKIEEKWEVDRSELDGKAVREDWYNE